MIGVAVISNCGEYRYSLERAWACDPGSAHRVNFVMLNPSTADATEDDPTIRKCVAFAKRLGYPSMVVTNLFAFRATNPKDLASARDPVGPDNDRVIDRVARSSAEVILAWGTGGTLFGRDQRARQTLHAANVTPRCLAVTRDGHPRHPIYLPYGVVNQGWFALPANGD